MSRPSSFSARVLEGELSFASLKSWQAALGRLEGQDVRVTVEPIGRQRSADQNARWWGVIVEAFSEWTGYEKDESHEMLKAMFLSREERRLPTGERCEIVPSTTSLTVEQFTELMDRAERWLALHGVDIGEG